MAVSVYSLLNMAIYVVILVALNVLIILVIVDSGIAVCSFCY